MGVYDFYNKAIMDHWFGIGDYDAVNLRYLDRSPNGLHASWVAGATAPTKIVGQHGISCDGGDYLSGPTQGRFNQSRISFGLLLRPSFAADDGNFRVFMDTVAPRYLLFKSNAGGVNVLSFTLGGTAIGTIALATYQPYWKVNSYNTLIVSGTTGDTRVYLNTYLIGTFATAWAAGDAATFYVASDSGLASNYAGMIHNVSAYSLNLTQIQATDWHFNAMRRVNDV